MPKLAIWLTPDVADHAWMDTRWASVHQDHDDDSTPFKRVMKSTVLKTNKGKKSFPIPSLCRLQLVNSPSDMYPQVLDSKLQEPSRSWLWAWAMASGKEEKQQGKPNGKYESWRLALRQTCPHSLPTSVKHQNVLTSKSQEAQLKHPNFVWK